MIVTQVKEKDSTIKVLYPNKDFPGPILFWYQPDEGGYVFQREITKVVDNVRQLYHKTITTIYTSKRTWYHATDWIDIPEEDTPIFIGECLGLDAYVDNSIKDFIFVLN